jgi:hypothetical protein
VRFGSVKFDQKNLSGSGRFDPSWFSGQTLLVFLGLRSFWVGFRVLMSLDHFGFRVIRDWFRSDFGSSDIG